MTESLAVTDRIGAQGATAPRITLDYIVGQIGRVYYIDGQTVARYAFSTDTMDKVMAPTSELLVITICMMVLKSGFVVVGKAAPMSPANYDRTKGQLFAYEDCIRQCWPLFAFAEKQGKAP